MAATKVGWRSGATLAELVVALVLAGVASALGAGMLVATERRTRRESAGDRERQTERDVMHVLATELSVARVGPGAARGDTAIDLDAHVGVSVVCVATVRRLVLPAARTSSGAAFTYWRLQAEPTDIVMAWDTAGATWREATVDSVQSRGDGAGCVAGGPFRTDADRVARYPVAVLYLSAALPGTVGPGSPVRIVRPVRWALYRGTDREWWLGYRRCPAGSCGAAQPVAGPLAAPPDSGLRFRLAPTGAVGLHIRAAPTGASVVSRTIAIRGAPGAPP